MNYQYRNGTTFPQALRAIYADGGIPRFYRGVLPALFQGPLSRFGDTAANTGVLTLLDNLESTKNMNVGVKTVAASAAAACFRIFLMPIDTVKVCFLSCIVGLGLAGCCFSYEYFVRRPCKSLENFLPLPIKCELPDH